MRTQGRQVGLLDEEKWHGRIFTGAWQRSAGGDAAVVAPATGEELGRVGMAGIEDVTASAAQAAVTQRDWAATPFHERAAVLRRAGEALQRHTDELRDWLVRETGSVPGKAYVEINMAPRNATGIAHINDQTFNDGAHVPFGGVLASGTGSRFGGAAANIEAFTESRWITARGDIPRYPF